MVLNLKKFYASQKWMGAVDLEGEPMEVTISDVKVETFPEGGQKPVLYFSEVKNGKGLPLNKTNFTTIEMIAGTDDAEQWKGVKIELFPTWVDFKGTSTEAIRCRRPTSKGGSKPASKPAKPQRPQRQATPSFSVADHAEQLDDEIPF
jgi:hypothetical protein